MYESTPDIPDEPLAISAPLAWEQSRQSCRNDPEDSASCAWNHGLWQFIRILGLAGTAANRTAFYQRTITAFLQNNPTARILISGSADYAMLAQILHAARKISASPMVTVADICETPLYLNRWYAEYSSIKIDTVRSDMLEFETQNPFDMICTDSFLGRFPHARWPQLASHWHTLLQPGGKLLTASQLRPASEPDRLVFEENQIIAFRNKVIDKARQQNMQTGLTADQFSQALTQYCRHQSNYPLRSETHLRSLLENAAFDIEELSTVVSASMKYKDVNGPTVSSGGKFLCVVATRR